MSKKTKDGSEPVEAIFKEFSRYHAHPANKLIHYFTIPLITMAVLGMIWAIPFPHLAFLKSYNGFVNWASFVIAFTIYYYIRQSPLISYVILLMVFAFSAVIVGLEKLHNQAGWPSMWQVCLAVFVVCFLLQRYGHSKESSVPSMRASLSSFLNGPLWLFYSVFRSKRSGHHN